MKLRISILSFLALTIFAVNSFGEEACLSSGTISVEEAKKILKPILGSAKVVGTAEAPIEGFYEVDIYSRRNGKVFPIYLDCNKEFVISGEIIDLKNGKSITRERMRELISKAEEYKKKEKELAKKELEKKIKNLEKIIGKEKVEKLKEIAPKRFLQEMKIINVKNAPEPNIIIGNPKAKLTVMIIEDPECPACAVMHNEVLKVVEKRPDIKFEIYLFPLPFHRHAKGIVQNIICASSQKEKAEILHKSFEIVNSKKYKELSKLEKECKKAEKTLKEVDEFANKVELTGTPTIVFPPNLSYTGVLRAEDIIKIVDVLEK